MERGRGICFFVHSYSWETLSGLQLTAGQLCTAQLEGLLHLFSGRAPGIG